jgi:hypothetical protein
VHAGLVDLVAVRAGGIAAVDDLGGVPALLADLGRRAGDPASGLPVLTFAGAFLTAPGGYPGDRSWAAPGSWREIRSRGDAEAAVGEQLAAGATRVKVAVNAAAGPVLAPSVLAAVVAAAHRGGVEVIAHAEGPGAVVAALDAGVDAFAHTPWTERLEAGLLAAAARTTTWVSTLAIHGYGVPSPALDVALANLRGFLAAGGTVRYGTDLGNGPLPLGVNPVEIRALQAAGLSPDDVLAAMTAGPPDGVPACVVPGGLDRTPANFATSLTRAQVIQPTSP